MALITDGYRAQNALHHQADKDFGRGGKKYLVRVTDYMKKYDTDDVLDYGCGKAALRESIPSIRCYDPAVAEFSALPEPADIVVCRDVMEHVEAECVDDVLDHIKSLTKVVALFLIVFKESSDILPDGRNAHVSIQPKEWWLDKLRARWGSVEVIAWREKDAEFVCV